MAQRKYFSPSGKVSPEIWVKDYFMIQLTLTLLSVADVSGSTSVLVLQQSRPSTNDDINYGTQRLNSTAASNVTSFIEPSIVYYSSIKQTEKLLSSSDKMSHYTSQQQSSSTSLSSESTHQILTSFMVNQTKSFQVASSVVIGGSSSFGVSSSSNFYVSSYLQPSSEEVSSSPILQSSYKPYSSQEQGTSITPVLSESLHAVSSALILNSSQILPSSFSISNQSSHHTSSSLKSSFYFNITTSQILVPSSCSIIVKTETVCQSSSHYMNISTINPSTSHQSRTINSTVSTKLFSSVTSVPVTTANHSDVSSHAKTTHLESSTILTSISLKTSDIKSTYSISPSVSTITVKTAEVLKPALHPCDIVANEFSKALNNYTTCVLMNLKPMEVCFGCVNQFESMRFHHRKVYHDCGKHLIGNYNARYQVVAQLFEIQQKTWNSLQCEKCYDRHSQTPQMIPKFQKFRKLYGDIRHCFAVHSERENKTLNGSDSSNSSVCVQCSPLYQELQSEFKYQEDSEENTDTFWCADINVAVNDTRHRWSGQYHCGVKEKDLASIIALTCFFCFLPIVFYVGAKLHADVKERKTNRYYESD